MGKFKGSQTERNLLTAFAGESQARNRYTYFAEQARQDGYIQIADIFAETACHEREHAKRFFKFLNGGEVEIKWSFPAGVIGSTYDNLLAAAAGESWSWRRRREVDGEEERGSLASDHLAASSSRLIRRKQGETSSLLFTGLYRPPVNPATWPFHFSQV